MAADRAAAEAAVDAGDAARDEKFPCKLVIEIPFPDSRLANTALRALSVDKELSPLVDRTFSLVAPEGVEEKTNLKVVYRATTNRMLRVSVNGFFESLRLVVQVMEDLDVDVVMSEGREELTKVQGLGEAAAGV